MKTINKLVLVSALMISSGTLLASSESDSSNVSLDQKGSAEHIMYFGEDVETVEKANMTLRNSAIAFKNVMKDPEYSIPNTLISQSEGIIIFPRAIKIALGAAGGQGARGIGMIRLEDGTWSNPFFVLLGEASVGIQIGAQKSDIVLLFKNSSDILAIDEADILLGAGMSVAAGPTSKANISNTDIDFEAEIYSYQRSKGLFAGISFNGGILSNNIRYNETLYGMNGVTSDEIFYNIVAPYNYRVSDLIETLDMYSR